MKVITVRNLSIQFDDSSLLGFEDDRVLEIVREHLEALNGMFQRISSCPQILWESIGKADVTIEDVFEDEEDA